MKAIDQSPISGKHALYGAGHVPSLTGLRAVGALLIIIYHFHKMPGTVLEPFVATGGVLGLMLFFALSGYIMSYVHHDLPLNEGILPSLAFIWRRLARIYPLHLFLIILSLLFFRPCRWSC